MSSPWVVTHHTNVLVAEVGRARQNVADLQPSLEHIDDYYCKKTSPQLVEDISIPDLQPEMHALVDNLYQSSEVCANILG